MFSEDVGTSVSAEATFWATQDVVEKVLPFLDAFSTLSLATVHPLTVQILKGGFFWNQLVERTCIRDLDAAKVEEQKVEMQHLAKIATLMGIPKHLLLDLLDVICRRCPPTNSWFVQLNCPRHKTHSISPEGFLLLEEVEGGVGSAVAVQHIEKVLIHACSGSLLTALSARVSRQQGLVELHLTSLHCGSLKDAEAIHTLLQNCNSLDCIVWCSLSVEIGIDGEGWAALAKALLLHPPRFHYVLVQRDVMLRADRGDLRTIWDVLYNNRLAVGEWVVGTGNWRPEVPGWEFEIVVDKEEGWALLEQVLDMSERQFLDYGIDDEEEDDEEEEDNEEEEEEDTEEEEEGESEEGDEDD